MCAVSAPFVVGRPSPSRQHQPPASPAGGARGGRPAAPPRPLLPAACAAALSCVPHALCGDGPPAQQQQQQPRVEQDSAPGPAARAAAGCMQANALMAEYDVPPPPTLRDLPARYLQVCAHETIGLIMRTNERNRQAVLRAVCGRAPLLFYSLLFSSLLFFSFLFFSLLFSSSFFFSLSLCLSFCFSSGSALFSTPSPHHVRLHRLLSFFHSFILSFIHSFILSPSSFYCHQRHHHLYFS
mgnify:CR=1 FL=1